MKVLTKIFAFMLMFSFSVSLVSCSTATSENGASKEKATNDNKLNSQKVANKNLNQQKQVNTITDPVKKESTPKKIDWNAPSDGAYPKLTANEPIWIDVSINDQRVYIKSGQKTIYTMIASSGLDTNSDDSTPKGTYHIEPERGEWFYSAGYKEGAEYWVSWKNHGEFLFHSVPMDQNKQVKVAEAEKLGKRASHGCIRLTIADAKWIFDNIKTGTKVVIRS